MAFTQRNMAAGKKSVPGDPPVKTLHSSDNPGKLKEVTVTAKRPEMKKTTAAEPHFKIGDKTPSGRPLKSQAEVDTANALWKAGKRGPKG